MASPPRVPDLEAQRAAMKKLDFLAGKWVGEARLARGPGETIDLVQTEEAQYKLDGLIMIIEGFGWTKSGGSHILQALGVVCYEDDSKIYRMRAFNDGRYLETEVKLSEGHKELAWGFALGEIRTHSVMRINERGEWTEIHQITIGSQPAK